MTAQEIEYEFGCDHDFFRMGAAVALGELFDEGILTDVKLVKDYLTSFGINSMKDLEMLNISNVYLSDFEEIYKAA